MMQERASTGRIYIQNVDHRNTSYSPFDPVAAPARQSKPAGVWRCLPTKPLNDVNDENGEIASVRCPHSTRAPLKLWTSWKNPAILAVRALMPARLSGLPDSGCQTRRNGPSHAGHWRD